MTTIRHLLTEIFNTDFSKSKNSNQLLENFFEPTITIADLKKVHDLVAHSTYSVNGKAISGALRIGSNSKETPFAILAQIHGNEPCGLAGFLMAMALNEAKLLTRDVLCIIGNTLAAEQYFYAYQEAPKARQEIRDSYRCGLGDGGVLLPDMNRIPSDFMERKPDTHHIRRAQELFALGEQVFGILDIHSARGNMLCITDHKHNSELSHSPIRAVLLELAEAISAHSSSGAQTVKTFKTIMQPLPNIKYQVGIEAGRHEAIDTPAHAALFTLSMLHAIGISKAKPVDKKESGIFDCYHVAPKWNYSDLIASGELQPDDKIYMCIPCMSEGAIPKRSDRVVVKKKDGEYLLQTIMQYMVKPQGEIEYAIYQYDEMETLHESAVVAVAVPSGVTFKAPKTAAGIFFSKSASLYDKDPAVGPWPLTPAQIETTKFCYPCDVKQEKLL